MFFEKVNTNLLKKIVKQNHFLKDKKNIIALGIDQGYANLGYAIVRYNIHTNKYSVLHYGTIQTNSKDEIQNRLYYIYNELSKIIQKYPIDFISCERLFVGADRNSCGEKKRNKSASIVKTNMATGIIYLLSGQYHLKIKEFSPMTIKKQLTGNGKANKEDIIQVVEELMTKQNLKVHTNHESDAIAIGITVISFYIEQILK